MSGPRTPASRTLNLTPKCLMPACCLKSFGAPNANLRKRGWSGIHWCRVPPAPMAWLKGVLLWGGKSADVGANWDHSGAKISCRRSSSSLGCRRRHSARSGLVHPADLPIADHGASVIRLASAHSLQLCTCRPTDSTPIQVPEKH